MDMNAHKYLTRSVKCVCLTCKFSYHKFITELLSFASAHAHIKTEDRTISIAVYTRVQVEFFGRENGLKKSTSTYIRENLRHTYRITKKCQNSLQQAKLRS